MAVFARYHRRESDCNFSAFRLFGFSALLSAAVTSYAADTLPSGGFAAESKAPATGSEPIRSHTPDDLTDYFHGIEAIDTGRIAEGVNLLQTYVSRNPSDVRGRLELARGLFLLGDNDSAQREFLIAKAANPPPAVVANIEVYLSSITQRLAKRDGQATPSPVSGYLEAGIGHDSNINGGVTGSSVTLPIAGAVTVDANGVQKSAMFSRYAAGVQGTWPLSATMALFVGGNVDGRYHFDDNGTNSHTFDTLYGSTQAGLVTSWERHILRGSISYNALVLNEISYRTSPSLSAEWELHVNDQLGAFSSIQYGLLQYQGDNVVRDASFYAWSGGIRRAFDTRWHPNITFALNTGREVNNREREDLSRSSYGGRIALEAVPKPKLRVSVSYSTQASDYLSNDLFFGLARRDNFVALELAATYTLNRNWSFRTDISASETKSNIALYSSQRLSGAVNVRYGF